MSSTNYQTTFLSQHGEVLVPWAGCSEGSSPSCKTVLSDVPPLISLGSGVGTCHLMQQMHRDCPRHLCGGRQNPPEMAKQPRPSNWRRLCWDWRSFAEFLMALGETPLGGELSIARGDVLSSCAFRVCLNLDQGTLGQAAAGLWVDGPSS